MVLSWKYIYLETNFKVAFSSFQRKMDQQTSDQFKEIEQFYSLSSFRNREFASGKGTTFVTRIDVPNRSKRNDYSSIPIHKNSRKNLCFEW